MISIISRKSPLARVQVEEFIALFSELEFSVIWQESMGDRDLKTSLMSSSVSADFFTRELDEAVLSGKADIAVHSAKDLPWPLPDGISVIALLEADDQSDSLVTLDGKKLKDLPQGARLGTSSVSRKEQILELRPDLEVVSIRGDIGQRIDYLHRGEADAVIVATCALKRLGEDDKISDILPIKTHPLQGNLAVTAKSGRGDLKQLFRETDIRRSFGKVTLVGAGPGDPELLTVKAVKAIQSADIVFYDALSGNDVLLDTNAECVPVGKRKGKHSLDQNEINELLYRAARDGNSVVRLKAGDPLLFSRGGEEICYLSERMISVSVIPGISSFQAAAASVNMPLTMRDYSRKFTASSGHYEIDRPIPVECDGTQAFFMAVTKLPELKLSLLKAGRSEDTSVVLVHNCSQMDEMVVKTTVRDLDTVTISTPAMIIVGEVGDIAVPKDKLLFTGIDSSRLSFSEELVQFPLIKTRRKQHVKVELGKYDAMIFTSRSAVRYFLEENTPLPGQKIFAVGPHTAGLLEENGISVDYMPDVYDAAHLTPMVRSSAFRSVLYICSDLSDNPLHDLEKVTPVVYYETVSPDRESAPELSLFRGVIFSSPSTVDAFFKVFSDISNDLCFYVYGESSRKRLLRYDIDSLKIVKIDI